LAEFCAVVIADRPILEAIGEGSPVGDAADNHHAVAALASVMYWLNERDMVDVKTAVGKT
jgi:hypothetical protein